MAYVPDEAIDRMDELSSGAWKLYCFLCRCRNQTTFKCNPSVGLIAKTIGVHSKNVFRLRRELVAKGWAAFAGDSATWMIYLSKNPIPEQTPNGSKNATTDDVTEELTPQSSKNATTDDVTSSKNATGVAKMLPSSSKNMPNGSKNATATKEEPAKNQQIEPCSLPSVEADSQNPDTPEQSKEIKSSHNAIQAVRKLVCRYPDKTLWPEIMQILGDEPDENRLTLCYQQWVRKGYNKTNLNWLFEWYPNGIPQKGSGQNGIGTHQATATNGNGKYPDTAKAIGNFGKNAKRIGYGSKG